MTERERQSEQRRAEWNWPKKNACEQMRTANVSKFPINAVANLLMHRCQGHTTKKIETFRWLRRNRRFSLGAFSGLRLSCPCSVHESSRAGPTDGVNYRTQRCTGTRQTWLLQHPACGPGEGHSCDVSTEISAGDHHYITALVFSHNELKKSQCFNRYFLHAYHS
jgi:hypothetical protein